MNFFKTLQNAIAFINSEKVQLLTKIAQLYGEVEADGKLDINDAEKVSIFIYVNLPAKYQFGKVEPMKDALRLQVQALAKFKEALGK